MKPSDWISSVLLGSMFRFSFCHDDYVAWRPGIPLSLGINRPYRTIRHSRCF